MPTYGKKDGGALYYQQSSPSVMKDELSLVRAASVREECLIQLSVIINEVNLQQRANDDSCILRTMVLLNRLRDVTYDVCDAIEIWQLAFTKIESPVLFGTDYIAGMASRQQFLNGTKLKKMYSFNIGTGNILILPTPNSAYGTSEGVPPPISSQLMQQLLIFSTPPPDRTLRFYLTLSKYLSKKNLKNVLPMQQWVNNPWTPPTPPLGWGGGSSSYFPNSSSGSSSSSSTHRISPKLSSIILPKLLALGSEKSEKIKSIVDLKEVIKEKSQKVEDAPKSLTLFNPSISSLKDNPETPSFPALKRVSVSQLRSRSPASINTSNKTVRILAVKSEKEKKTLLPRSGKRRNSMITVAKSPKVKSAVNEIVVDVEDDEYVIEMEKLFLSGGKSATFKPQAGTNIL